MGCLSRGCHASFLTGPWRAQGHSPDRISRTEMLEANPERLLITKNDNTNEEIKADGQAFSGSPSFSQAEVGV